MTAIPLHLWQDRLVHIEAPHWEPLARVERYELVLTPSGRILWRHDWADPITSLARCGHPGSLRWGRPWPITIGEFRSGRLDLDLSGLSPSLAFWDALGAATGLDVVMLRLRGGDRLVWPNRAGAETAPPGSDR